MRMKHLRNSMMPDQVPEGYVHIGTISVMRYTVRRITLSESKLVSASFPRNIYILGDESGTMGMGQGSYYVMGVSVVSDWNLYGKFVRKDSDGSYIKSKDAFESIFKETVETANSMLERTYMIAIRKGSSTPNKHAQHRIHAGGIMALANHIMRTEKAQRIDVLIDRSKQTLNWPIERIFEENAYRGGRSVEANQGEARNSAPLSMHDYIVGAEARWMRDGTDTYLNKMTTQMYYCITNIDKIEKLGHAAVLAIQQNLAPMPVDSLVWRNIKLPDEKPERDNHTKQNCASESIHHNGKLGSICDRHIGVSKQRSLRNQESSGCKNPSQKKQSKLLLRDAKGRFVKKTKTPANKPKVRR